MIVRAWHGWTAPAHADAYESLLRTKIFPHILSRGIPGFRRIELLRRTDSAEVEFVTLMEFDSLDSVRAFAGPDWETAVVPPEARALLARFDACSQHYERREDCKAAALPTPADFKFWIEDRVRFADLDPVGHANNAAIAGFFETARVAMLEHAGLKMVGGAHSFAIVREGIDFIGELSMGEAVRIGLRVGKIGRTSLAFSYGLFAGERCAAAAEIVGVAIDMQTRRPVEIAPAWREVFARYA